VRCTIVALSTEHNIARGSAQHDWLVTTLVAIDRSVTPWVVLAGHRPYIVDSSWSGDQGFAAYFQAAVGDMLQTHRVDLILGGHHHSYQRSCSVRGSRCAATGTIILNIGMGGAGLNTLNATMPPVFHYVDDEHFGYCRIIADRETLTAEFVHSADSKVYDSVTIQKHLDDLYA